MDILMHSLRYLLYFVANINLDGKLSKILKLFLWDRNVFQVYLQCVFTYACMYVQ